MYHPDVSRPGDDSLTTSLPTLADDWTFQDGIVVCFWVEGKAVIKVGRTVKASRRSDASATREEGAIAKRRNSLQAGSGVNLSIELKSFADHPDDPSPQLGPVRLQCNVDT